jgi:predicted RNA-binding Zn-ribbon protein involved in translation (DUF1610 family)
MDEEVYKTIATALRTGVRGDIWDGQQNGPDFAVLNTQRAVLIAATQAAMEAAADILHKEEVNETKTTIRYECPICGEESMYADDNVTMYWNVAAQAWEASDGGIPDERTTLYCGDCGEESTVAEAKEEEPDDPVQAYLKRMAERGDDEAKSLIA